jgi:hypothetical protein
MYRDTGGDQCRCTGLCSSMLMHAGAAPESHGHNFNFLILPKIVFFAAAPGQSKKMCIHFRSKFLCEMHIAPNPDIYLCTAKGV